MSIYREIAHGFNIGLLDQHGIALKDAPSFEAEVKRLANKFDQDMKGCPLPPLNFVSQKDEE